MMMMMMNSQSISAEECPLVVVSCEDGWIYERRVHDMTEGIQKREIGRFYVVSVHVT